MTPKQTGAQAAKHFKECQSYHMDSIGTEKVTMVFVYANGVKVRMELTMDEIEAAEA
jgi:hypothetical protein